LSHDECNISCSYNDTVV